MMTQDPDTIQAASIPRAMALYPTKRDKECFRASQERTVIKGFFSRGLTREKSQGAGQNRTLIPAFRDIPEKLTRASRGALTRASVGMSRRMITNGKSPRLPALTKK